jgi:hypothetical protein
MSKEELNGTELNRAVAERVMGWSSSLQVGIARYENRDPPRYSSSIEAAMRVIDKLRQSGEWCCIEIKSDYHYVWWVALTPAEGSGNGPHKPTVARQDESLPVAICRAALAAIEKQKNA